MLLTVTLTRPPATDLGFLLHKHPGRLHTRAMPFGPAHVFYPEATEERCTATLLLDTDPVGLVRGRRDAVSLEPYINDRPYVASSFLSSAIAEHFGTAMNGRSKERQDLADQALPFEAHLPAVVIHGGEPLARRLFEPLGYTVAVESHRLEEAFADWGEAAVHGLTIAGTVRLRDLLSHLYVLIPVLDDRKHYWVAEPEIDKLLARGEGWLADHPERELITSRYLARQGNLTREALRQLTAGEEVDPDAAAAGRDDEEAAVERPIRLSDLRVGAVMAALRASGATRVLDLGCGEGRLLADLVADHRFTEIVGMDVSARSLEIAARRLRTDRMNERQAARLKLIQGSLIYRDARLEGFEAAVLMEVIEHLEPDRLRALERAVFAFARPVTVVLTTPNAEYNALFATLPAGRYRHRDHRFEWTRTEFAAWADGVAARHGYAVRYLPVGDEDAALGAPTQMAVFERAGSGGFGMKIALPELSLVVLVGTTGSGKTTFGRRVFKPTEVLSSDFFRGLVADDENDQGATGDAFEALHFVAAKRLAAGRLTVIDATNVQPEARKPLVALARQYHVLPVAIVLDIPERICEERNRGRADREFGPHVLARQRQQLKRSIGGLQREGFRHVWVLKPEDVDTVEVERQPLWNNKKHLVGPFDIIGDVHGCGDELEALLAALGYEAVERLPGLGLDAGPVYAHPGGRTAVFLGDLVDRGPRVLDSLRIVRNMVDRGSALCVMGNHEQKLLRSLSGRQVQVTHGLAQSLAEIDAVPAEDRAPLVEELKKWLDGLVSHYVLDGGKLVVAHAGLKADMQGRGSGAVREFALYGDTTGEKDEFGLPVRLNWAADYRGAAMVVYGHTPVPEAEWLNKTIDIDTGCVFGGRLTALRYPERALVSVPAEATYYEPARPFLPVEDLARKLTAQQATDDVLDLADVTGKRLVETRLAGRVTIREENGAAALEVMSRFAVDPRWLVYLPPTMSPSETSTEPGYLEHPTEALAYFRSNGVPKVVIEQKHMGSRAVVVVCRSADAARQAFGVVDGRAGIVYTRTGRPFFSDANLETGFLARVRGALDRAGTWKALETDWIVLDAELMPWSAKAQDLIRQQYAPVGVAATTALPAAAALLEMAAARGVDVGAMPARMRERQELAERYVAAYRRYTWPVASLDDLRLAPFHLMASAGKVHADRDHVWHMESLAAVCREDSGLLVATPYRVVDVTDAAEIAEAVAWWEELTGRGGEGMVVKPLDFVPARGGKRPVQPAVKCRGREYLRIIYGAEYTLPEHLERLRERGLAGKRGLAHREFALGIEGLERFVRGEPLRRVHECAFAVLALESEPIDPRL